MKQVTGFVLSSLIVGVVTLLFLIAYYCHQQANLHGFFCFLGAGILSLVFTYFLLHYTVFARLRGLNKELETSLKKKKVLKNKRVFAGADVIFELERSVQLLINEKASEIDNLIKLEEFRKEFLGNVAHELRSPIFTIQGYVYTLLGGALNDTIVNKKFLEKAANQIDHLSSLVEDLVTINMIESGQWTIDYSDFNLKDLANEVVELLDLQAKKREISLSIKCRTENSIYVHADKQKIRQVFINLVGNSIKYGRDGGHTVISIEELPNNVSIEISDNGEGIAEEHINRIFERFYRIDKSRSRSQVSTGLGLSIVKHFLEAHKQKILVSSIMHVGSIFSFTLEKTKAN